MPEFSHEAVRTTDKKRPITIFAVTLGLTAVTTNLIVGAALAAAMSRTQWVSAILLGGIALSIIAGHTAYYSARTGRSFGGQMTDVFGGSISRIVVTFAALVILGWYVIQASLLGGIIASWVPSIPSEIILVLTPLVMAITSFFGFRALATLSWLAVPIIATGAVLVLSTPSVGINQPNGAQMPFATAVSLVFSLWIMGSIATIADVMRFEQSAPRAAFLAIVAFLFGNTALMVVGALAFENYGSGDVATVLQMAGLGLVGAAFLIASIWSTNDNAMYSISLNINRATGISARTVVVIAAVVAANASLLRPYEVPQLSAWLGLLGNVVPPIGGAIIAARIMRVRFSAIAAAVSISAGAAIAFVNPGGWGVIASLPASLIVGVALSKAPALRTPITGA